MATVNAEPTHPELQPADERAALVRELDRYRSSLTSSLADLTRDEASRPHLPGTDMTVAGIVRHLAWAEDRWFQGRLLGVALPPPWDTPGADDPDHSMRLRSSDTVDGIVELYTAACARSRDAIAGCGSLDAVAIVPSFGSGPVNLRWILVHMISETAQHAGHVDVLRDSLGTR